MIVATRLFNRKGFLGTTMDELARALNTTPGNIYHYVKSKEELAYKCYLRSCEARRSQIQLANEPSMSGVKRVERLFRSVLADGQSRSAILSEVGALKPEWASQVRRLQRENISAVQRMVADGITDRSIAASNPFLTGIGLLGIIEWISFWYSTRLPYSREEIVDAMVDIILRGVTKERPYDIKVPALSNPFPPGPELNPFDKQAMATIKIQRFLQVAMQSFNRNGVQATSIDKLAQQLDLTKGAFYHYFKNKEELLYQCYVRSIAFNSVALTHETVANENEREILTRRSLFERHVSDLGPFPAYTNLTSLGTGHQTQVMNDLAAMQNEDRKRIEHAIAVGDFRPVNPFVAEKVRAGLINWFPLWYSTDGRYTPTEIADNHSRLFLNGLLP